MEIEKKLRRSILFTLFLICGISISVVPLLFSDSIELCYRVIVCVIFVVGAETSRRKTSSSKYFLVLFAFFVTSLVGLFEYLLYFNQSLLYWVSSSRIYLRIIVINSVGKSIFLAPLLSLVLCWEITNNLFFRSI